MRIADRRRMKSCLQVPGRTFLPDGHTALTALRRLLRSLSRQQLTRRNRPEMVLDAAHDVARVDVADDDERGVVRDVVAAVVRVQILARHRLQI